MNENRLKSETRSSSQAPSFQHFTDVVDHAPAELHALLDLADAIATNPDRLTGSQKGRLLVNLFYEPSTRTRLSFEVAAKRMGMHVTNVSSAGSSVEKGESLEDTFDTVQALSPDCVVLRHPEPGAAARMAALAGQGLHVINAGDGIGAHPTQAMLDALTLRQAFGSLDRVRLVMAGDIRHSRVARSAIHLFPMMGISEIRLCGPADFMPGEKLLAAGGAALSRFERLEDALPGANAIMMLRIQKERISSAEIPAAAEYHRQWGLRPEHLELAEPECRVLHPGPMNRGVEIASEVADGPNSLIRTQVRNGLFLRMALLQCLLQGHPSS
ncbi:MAG: aspartate carbamoyltransferase catalytic subunit [Xanthomonadales bacterium]|nr:aspartate carbamoyltransferase catalytic subunit [Xanthomonadales bacterium]